MLWRICRSEVSEFPIHPSAKQAFSTDTCVVPAVPTRNILMPFLRLLCVQLLLLTAAAQESPAADPAEDVAEMPRDPAPGAVQVPDGILDGGARWLNTSRPIVMKELRGKVVLFDFWTYCCINCMHVLPDLRFLEEKYQNELVVIGVHSAKFDNEKDSENIRNAIMRYGIEHPVVNDSEMIIWRKFGVEAWPTLALVDPQGRYLGSRSGEGNREVFDEVIGEVIRYHRAAGKLDENPIVFDLETRHAPNTPLRYPGKVLADADSGRLFISDTSHNRIVIARLDGSVANTVGSGRIGRRDGSWDDAEFDHPQGMCLVDSTLYVADTENHLIRTIDLESESVGTLAGTGAQGRLGALTKTSLNSPWALCHIDGVLYIAMAGPHQIWSHRLGTDRIDIHAGNAREDVINGPLPESSFAQPSGLVVATDDSAFFVADSEGSAIRRVPVSPDEYVTTIAGTSELPRGQSLFAFGDVDAAGGRARFQHPIGVARHGNILYVADSYNHKIRTVDLTSHEVATWIGDGQAGNSVQPVRLNEPSGLSIADNSLYIADTNNHRICAVDLVSKEFRVLKLDGLQPPDPSQRTSELQLADAVDVEEQAVPPGAEISIRIRLTVPDGGKLNELAPVRWQMSAIAGNLPSNAAADRGRADVDNDVATIPLTLSDKASSGMIGLKISYGYCETDDALCRLADARWKIPIRIDEQSTSRIIELTVAKQKTYSQFP